MSDGNFGNSYQVIGVSENIPDINDIYIDWNHTLVTDTSTLDECNPDIGSINTLYVKGYISNARIIDMPLRIEADRESQEGFYSTGKFLLIEGVLCLTVVYIADNANKSIHSASYTIPFSHHVALNNSAVDNNTAKYKVKVYVEDAFVNMPDSRTLYTTVSVYFTATPEYVSKVTLNNALDLELGDKNSTINGVVGLRNTTSGKVYYGKIKDNNMEVLVYEPGDYVIDSVKLQADTKADPEDSEIVTVDVTDQSIQTASDTIIATTDANTNGITVNSTLETPIALTIDTTKVSGQVTGLSTIEGLSSAELVFRNKTKNDVQTATVTIGNQGSEPKTYEFDAASTGEYELEKIIAVKSIDIGGEEDQEEVEITEFTPITFEIPKDVETTQGGEKQITEKNTTVIPYVEKVSGTLNLSDAITAFNNQGGTSLQMPGTSTIKTDTALIFESEEGVLVKAPLTYNDTMSDIRFTDVQFNNKGNYTAKVLLNYGGNNAKDYSLLGKNLTIVIPGASSTSQQLTATTMKELP